MSRFFKTIRRWLFLLIVPALAGAQNAAVPAVGPGTASTAAPVNSGSPAPPPAPNRAGSIVIPKTVTVNESEINFHKDTSHPVWNSPRQLNDYYLRNYLGSADSIFSSGSGMWRPDLRLEPSFRYLQGQKLTVNGTKVMAAEAFILDKIELIGIARHDSPLAYTVNRHSSFNPDSNRGPNTFEANNPVKVSGERPLTDFEKSALAQIKAGQETVSQRQADGSLVIVGVIPTQGTCFACHPAYNKVGDALGAFSYHLSPVNLLDSAAYTSTLKVSPPLAPSH